jgi:predicted Zn-dependent protease
VAVLAARIALLLGDQEGAVKRYRRARRAMGDSVIVATELGLLLSRMSRCSEGVQLLEPVFRADSANTPTPSVRRALARCYLELDQPQSASAVLYEYAEDHPEDGSAQLLLAKACLADGDLLTAARTISLARRSSPEVGEVVFVQARPPLPTRRAESIRRRRAVS